MKKAESSLRSDSVNRRPQAAGCSQAGLPFPESADGAASRPPQ